MLSFVALISAWFRQGDSQLHSAGAVVPILVVIGTCRSHVMFIIIMCWRSIAYTVSRVEHDG